MSTTFDDPLDEVGPNPVEVLASTLDSADRVALLEFAHDVQRKTSTSRMAGMDVCDAVAMYRSVPAWLEAVLIGLDVVVAQRNAVVGVAVVRQGDALVVTQGGYVVDVVRGIEAFDDSIVRWRRRGDRHRKLAKKQEGLPESSFHVAVAVQSDKVVEYLEAERAEVEREAES